MIGCRSQQVPATPQRLEPVATDAATLSSQPDASAPDAQPAEPGARACGPGEQPAPTLAEVPEQFAWRVRETVASNGHPPQIVAACQRLSTAADRARNTIAAALGQESRAAFEAIGQCHYAGNGAWALEAGRARVRTVRENSSAIRVGEVDWTIVFVKGDGALVRSTHHGVHRAGSEEIATVEWTLFHDLDRDGTAEAGFTITRGNAIEGTPVEDRGTLLSFANNAIGPYARAPSADPSRAYDADGDGDPDLVTRSQFSAGNTCGPAVFYGPNELLVLGPDGAFDGRGAASQEFVRAQCEDLPALPVNFWVEGGGEAPFRVACWRYQGASIEEIQRMIDRDWPADADDHCNSREGTIASLRRAQPAFRLATRCR
ncbi:MAG: hypothetical protein U0269_22710 [Polyangiales bacterium]